MAPVTHVTVTAPEGKHTPVNSADGVEPGGGQLFVTADSVVRVKYSHTTIRSIARKDLTLCDLNGAPVASAELAAAPDQLPGGRVSILQRKLDAIKATTEAAISKEKVDAFAAATGVAAAASSKLADTLKHGGKP